MNNVQDLDKTITKLLDSILNYFNADRVYVFEFSYPKNKAFNSYETAKKGVEIEKSSQHNINLNDLKCLIDGFKEHELIYYDLQSNHCDCESDLDQFIINANINSLFAIPFYMYTGLKGFIGVDNPCENIEEHEFLSLLTSNVFNEIIKRNIIEQRTSSMTLYQDLVTNIDTGIVTLTSDEVDKYRPTFVNDGMLRMLKMTPKQFRATYRKDILYGFNENDKKRVRDIINQNIENNINQFSINFNLLDGNGNYFWYKSKIRIINHNEVLTINLVFVDIDEEIKNHSKIKELSVRLNSIITSSPIPFYWKNTDGRYLGCNSSFLELTRYSNESEVIDKNDFEVFGKKNYEVITETDFLVLNGEKIENLIIELEIKNHPKMFKISKVPYYENTEIVAIISMFEDVTAENNNRLELEFIKEIQKSALQYNNLTVAIYDPINDIFRNIESETEIFEFKKYILNDKFIYEDDKRVFLNNLNKIIEEKNSNVSFDTRLLIKGRYEWYNYSFNSTTDYQNKNKILMTKININDYVLNKQRYENMLFMNKSMENNRDSFSFLINVTKNVILNQKINGFFKDDHFKTMEDIIEIVEKYVTDDKNEEIVNILKLDYLLNLNSEGISIIEKTFDAKILGRIQYYSGKLEIVIEPNSKDVICYIYSENVTDKVLSEKLLNDVTISEFKYLALINRESSEVFFVDANNKRPLTIPYEDFYLRIVEDINVEEIKDHLTFDFLVNYHLLTNLSYVYEVKNQNQSKWFEVKIIFIDDISFVIVCREVTQVIKEQMMANSALKSALNIASDANTVKTDFLNQMSHDIRTPMNAIVGMTDLAIEKDKQGYLKEELEIIKDSSAHLLAIINDILNMSRIESKKEILNEEIVSLENINNRLISLMSQMFNSKNQVLIHRMEIKNDFCFVDEEYLLRVLENILTNAHKFSPEYSDIKIEWLELESTVKNNVNTYQITVSDSGVGISESNLEKIFDPFFRADSLVEGTGLGLPIVKGIVDLMGGDIKVISELGKGTRVKITLNLRATDQKYVKREIEKNIKSLKNSVILLVDDNEVNVMVAERMLDSFGCKVIVAKNNLEAIEQFKNNNKIVDLILMDIQMPLMNGNEASRIIRSLNIENAKEVVIIAMTANAFIADIIEAKEAGMNDHLAKPVDRYKLNKTLEVYLKGECNV